MNLSQLQCIFCVFVQIWDVSSLLCWTEIHFLPIRSCYSFLTTVIFIFVQAKVKLLISSSSESLDDKHGIAGHGTSCFSQKHLFIAVAKSIFQISRGKTARMLFPISVHALLMTLAIRYWLLVVCVLPQRCSRRKRQARLYVSSCNWYLFIVLYIRLTKIIYPLWTFASPYAGFWW